jgi:hypothetical protein
VLAVLLRDEWRIAMERGARRAALICSSDCKLWGREEKTNKTAAP